MQKNARKFWALLNRLCKSWIERQYKYLNMFIDLDAKTLLVYQSLEETLLR